MTSTEPPKLARWLLNHFGCSPNNNAVLGDLDEQYRNGHSRMWYWRQVAIAIVASFFNEVRGHKLRALTAILTGWLAIFLCYLLLRPVSPYINQLWPDSPVMHYVFTRILPESWAAYYKSFCHPVLDFVLRLLMICLAGEISGRIVSYVAVGYRKPMVLTYAVSILFVSSWVFVDVSLTDTDVTGSAGFAWPILAAMVVLTASVLHGGRLFVSPAASARRS
jgi:hypothetical protein